MDEAIDKLYGNRVRVRVGGICYQNDRLLLVNHDLRGRDFWAPPGGGIEFGTSLQENLIREIYEETGLDVDVGDFLFGCEFIAHPLHAVELYFSIHVKSGKLAAGYDPEFQIIKGAAFLSPTEISQIPKGELHGILTLAPQGTEIGKLRGFYRI